MSPTLGSGKISWSRCSRAYLHRFLSSSQASCLTDRVSWSVVDGEEERLPGQRFPADIQCRLRYGPESFHSSQQEAEDTCRDLHCKRNNYIWTSHPALEGTACGGGRWCRSGSCVAATAAKLTRQASWSSWTESACRSSCLYSLSGSLARGSTGLVTATRDCRGGKTCHGKNFRFTTCNAVRDCMSERKLSVADHSRQACQAASRQDSNLLPYGDVSSLLQGTNRVQACSVSCYTLDNVKVTRGWTFPDGNSGHHLDPS